MMRVYLLHHVRVRGDGEDAKLIGVYRSETSAGAAIARLSDKPGFRDHPDGFHVEPHTLDVDHWVEGFVTVSDTDAETADSAETERLARIWSFAKLG